MSVNSADQTDVARLVRPGPAAAPCVKIRESNISHPDSMRVRTGLTKQGGTRAKRGG